MPRPLTLACLLMGHEWLVVWREDERFIDRFICHRCKRERDY